MMLLRSTRRTIKSLALILGGVIILFGAIYAGYLSAQHAPVVEPQKPEETAQKFSVEGALFDTKGFKKIELHVSPGKFLLSENCTGIVISTTTEKTYEVQRGFDHTYDLRPNTHDVIEDLLDVFHVELLGVKIYELKNDIFYSSMLLQRDNEVLDLDTKPSDAFVLAARFNKPIYIADSIFKQLGTSIC